MIRKLSSNQSRRNREGVNAQLHPLCYEGDFERIEQRNARRVRIFGDLRQLLVMKVADAIDRYGDDAVELASKMFLKVANVRTVHTTLEIYLNTLANKVVRQRDALGSHFSAATPGCPGRCNITAPETEVQNGIGRELTQVGVAPIREVDDGDTLCETRA